MSHYTVLVTGENPEEQLEPFYEQTTDPEYLEFIPLSDREIEDQKKYYLEKKESESYSFDHYMEDQGFKKQEEQYGYITNPNGKWDWYQLGGRWRGFFKAKRNKTGTLGDPGTFGNQTKSKKNHYDSIKIKDIDFIGMKKEQQRIAKRRYLKVQKLCGGQIPRLSKTWEQCVAEYSDPEERRSVWNDIKFEFYNAVKDTEFRFESPEDFQCSIEEYVEKESNDLLMTYAILHEGIWHESGEMGWFGISANEKEATIWKQEWDNLFNNLDKETVVSIYDCHI